METHPFRALALDLDGTLLSPDEQVSPRNLAALRAAAEAGYHVIIASARWYQLAARVAREVPGSRVVIACSGAEVRRLSDGHDLLDLRLPAAFCDDLYDLCDEERCVATFVYSEQIVVKMDGVPDRALLAPEMVAVERLDERGHEPPRIALIQGSKATERILAELEPRWVEAVRFVNSISSRGKPILTLTAAGADKGTALAVACAELDLHTDEVIAFGDAENDIEMFRVAGAAVAMGQANDHVKSHATWITAPNTEDGVGQAIERLLATGKAG